MFLFFQRSEPNPDVVPAPQAQTSSSSPSSTPGDSTASSSAPQGSQDNIHLPPPPLPGHRAGAYQTVKRKGTVGSDELEGNLATLGGRPRSVEGLSAELRGARRRRTIDDAAFDPVSYFIYLFFLIQFTNKNKKRIHLLFMLLIYFVFFFLFCRVFSTQ